MAGDRPSPSTTSESPSDKPIYTDAQGVPFDPQPVREPVDFIHPETGELLATEDEWRTALTAVEEKLSPLFNVRAALRNGYAERFEPAAQPVHRRNRTDTQEKVARCPRCGERLPREESDA